MKQGGTVNMVGRVRGIMGELGGRTEMSHEREGGDASTINVEVLSVGRLFKELDFRSLYLYIKRPPFYQYCPI
jgi:hypothetical protein